jgi:glyoxylase-like metal-dependent hydrolase (beta-lactamase superfamily II)
MTVGLSAAEIVEVSEHLKVVRGPVNGALLQKNGKTLVVYGDPHGQPPGVDQVLFTSHRRDAAWAGVPLVEAGALSVVPAREAQLFNRVGEFWLQFVQDRFHDYAQQTTRVLRERVRVDEVVDGGDHFDWEGIPFYVLNTPGYTPGAVSYVAQIDDRKIVFTGDLVYGDGRILDWYSLQDQIPGISRGYHGYGARSAQVLASLDLVARQRPDLLIPSRGPIITDVESALTRLKDRIRALYGNYLSISAYSWYRKKDDIKRMAERVLGSDGAFDQMPEATVKRLPDWVIPINNSRLIMSEDGSGFLLDCGSEKIVDQIRKLRDTGRLSALDAVYITHYHDDHTDQVMDLVREFGCPVYACSELQDILEHPGAYRLPAMTETPIEGLVPLEHGGRLDWKNLKLTSFYFPGQTIYHGALLVEKPDGESIFFLGDSFTPTGIDDYCPQNRNLLYSGKGYFRCLEMLAELEPETYLVNQHVLPMFTFSETQIEYMKTALERRIRLAEQLFAWNNANFGFDEGWARFYPHGQTVSIGSDAAVSLKIFNHSDRSQDFRIKLNLPAGWVIDPGQAVLRVPAGREGNLRLTLTLPRDAAPGVYVYTADVSFAKRDLGEWSEGLLIVK